ncbi:hypothetical protein DK37_07245 [Halomonas sp. SUBG004]|nr:hypothetical protein DK37_07245 [Halomonas sp. SUBG004]
MIIIGGILLGIATPTESAALASLAALLMGRFVYGDLRLTQLPMVLTRTAINAGLVIMLIAAAGCVWLGSDLRATAANGR